MTVMKVTHEMLGIKPFEGTKEEMAWENPKYQEWLAESIFDESPSCPEELEQHKKMNFEKRSMDESQLYYED